MSEQITYDDKVDLVVATNTANINKVTANDMNEIKSVVNANADTLVTTNSNIGTLSNLTTTDKTSVVNAINELNAPEKWVNVGATNSNDGRRVWFSKSRNVFDKSITKTSQASALLITETSLDTGKRLTLTGNATSGNVFVVYTIMDLTNYVGKTIRFKADFTPSGTNNGNYYIGICNKDGSNRNALGGTPNTSGTTTSFVVPTLTSPQTWLCLALYINTSGAISTNTYVDFTNMIITINDTNMTYEPYIQQGIYVDNELLYQVPKLLWQNTDTSSVFANQEISLNDNINNYQYYEILSLLGNGGQTECFSSGKLPTIKINTRITVPRQYIGYREITLNGTKMTIGDYGQLNTYGNTTATTNNGICIPYLIYGYK